MASAVNQQVFLFLLLALGSLAQVPVRPEGRCIWYGNIGLDPDAEEGETFRILNKVKRHLKV